MTFIEFFGIFAGDEFCGLAEFYGYHAPCLKVSVGYRLLEKWWGKGISSETLGIMTRYLFSETNVKIITASTMAENKASANVLKKNGYRHLTYTVLENWGLDKPILTEKWIIANAGERLQYHFREEE